MAWDIPGTRVRLGWGEPAKIAKRPLVPNRALHRWREGHRGTWAQLAAAAGLSAKTVQRIAAGRAPSVAAAVAIAAATGIPVRELVAPEQPGRVAW